VGVVRKNDGSQGGDCHSCGHNGSRLHFCMSFLPLITLHCLPHQRPTLGVSFSFFPLQRHLKCQYTKPQGSMQHYIQLHFTLIVCLLLQQNIVNQHRLKLEIPPSKTWKPQQKVLLLSFTTNDCENCTVNLSQNHVMGRPARRSDSGVGIFLPPGPF
jgi:hypothetical protein